MIKRCSRLAISANSNRFSRFRRLGGCFMAATASNITFGQRDYQMPLRRLSSIVSYTSSVVELSNGRLFTNGFRLKGCSSENYGSLLRNGNDCKNDHSNFNGLQKARVYGPCFPPLLRVHEEVVKVEEQQKSLNSRAINGGGAASRGNFAGVLDHPSPEKIMVAVDVDEVLGNFVSALNRFIADRYSLNHSVSEYHVYEFFKIWNCSRDEAIGRALLVISLSDVKKRDSKLHSFVAPERKAVAFLVAADVRVHEFFKTPYFKKGIYPIPGAREALERLSETYNMSIVTSRQNAIKEHTIQWIEKHYPGLFQEIHFGNHFALDGKSRPKSEICKTLGAKVLIDDNPRYAIECASVGIKVLLFDYENSYPWCKGECVPQHPLVTKVHNWEDVEHQLSSWVVS